MICLLSIYMIPVMSQPVVEAVFFDSYVSPGDNDFVNRFTGGLGMSQLTTSGITGGCLTLPNTVSWGNDNAIYCSKYIDSVSYTTNTRVAFKYDTTQSNGTNFDRAVSLFLRPSADFNHDVIASITYDQKIQIVSYSAVNNPVSVNLQHNHWYDFILITSCLAPAPVYQLSAATQLNDLGLSGTFPPIPAGNSSITFNDSLLYVDSAIQVSFTGTQWGGAKFIDNFRFQGVKSADSCNTSTHVQVIDQMDIEILIQGHTIAITHALPTRAYEVIDLSGRVVLSGEAPPGGTLCELDGLRNGIYILRISGSATVGNNTTMVRKFILTDHVN